jgi:hypothetical protein
MAEIIEVQGTFVQQLRGFARTSYGGASNKLWAALTIAVIVTTATVRRMRRRSRE